MSARVELRVDALSFEEGDGPADEARVREAVREALARLGERMGESPWGRSGAARLALERLELELGSVDDLLGPRGAERLADELYATLTRRLP